MTDKISEIKFISENHDMLISKIDLTNHKLSSIINEITIDLKDCVVQFTETINNKLKVIENKFNKQTEELAILKKDLENKSFDDKNYMNVSITMNLSKQIKERDLKIKELEQRIKFIENKKQLEVIPEVTPEIITKELICEEVISKEVIPIQIITEEITKEITAEVIPEVIPEVIKSKSKKISDKSKQIEKNLDTDSSDDKPKKKAKKNVKNEEIISVVEVIPVVEIIPVVEVIPVVEAITVEEIIPVEEKKSKKKDSNKVKKEKIVKSDTTEISIENKNDKDNKDNKDNKDDKNSINTIEVKHPDTVADITDIDILELNNKDYFIDKKNNVYQITDDQDIGIFLGLYDKLNKTIIYV